MHILTPFFKDKPASDPRTNISYDNTLRRYVSSSLSKSMSTPATQRLSVPVTRRQPQIKTLEDSGVSGKRILNVIVPVGLDDDNGQIDTRFLDSFRAGRNIKSYKHFASQVFRPMIRISPEGFFEDETDDKINHFASFNAYGMGMHYKIVDENYKVIPVKDFSELIPTDLVGRETALSYPFIFDAMGDFTQFLDPSNPVNDGAVDIFEVRRSIANLSHNDIRLYGIKGNLQAGGIEQNKKGSTVISSRFEINKVNCAAYDDAQETIFKGFTFAKLGSTGSGTSAFPLPGFLSDERHNLSPFSDKTDHIAGSYLFATSRTDMLNFLSSSRDRISEVGSRFKSSTCGLIFGESNKLGTDSIAFGGLKK